MAPKRKASIEKAKASKNHKSNIKTINKKSHRNDHQEEIKDNVDLGKDDEVEIIEKVIAVVIEQKSKTIASRMTTSETTKTATPLSAIAARRAAINAGTYKPEPAEEEEEEIEQEEEIEENPEGIDVKSITDEEEEENTIIPISGAVSPNDEPTTPRPILSINREAVSIKLKNKIPELLDDEAVSKFVPTKNNTCIINQEDDTFLFLGLESGEDILFLGQVLAAPLYGSISIAGAVVSSGRPMPPSNSVPNDDLLVSFYPVFSPRTHSLLRIASEPLESPSITSHYNPIEIDEHLLEAVFDELKGGRDRFESILVIKDLEGSGLEDMRSTIESFNKNLVKMTKKESIRDMSNEINFLPGFHPILEPTPGIKPFKIETSWHARSSLALNNATLRKSPLVSVVCGAKDMGKSSFSRYLVNRLLAKHKTVAYLETDLGQSELTPSGLLSLHYLTNPILGPPYTHQQLEPERSFFYGSNSPRSNPDYYLDCINELVDHWKRDQDEVQDEAESDWIPLVVNTQGWVSGVGYNLLISQIHKIEPTDIFTMRHHVLDYKNLPASFNLDILPEAEAHSFKMTKESATLHYVDCVLQDTGVTTLKDTFMPTQLRDIALGSYFNQVGMGSDHYLLPNWDYKKHMVDRTPWVVDWRKNLNAVWVIYEEVKFEELFYALNGSLVGLIGDVIDFKQQDGPKENLMLDDDATSTTFTPPIYYNTQDQPAPSPQRMTCYGLGIIRAIDPSRHSFLLLTPLPLNTLEKVSGIVKGEMQLPLWAMLGEKLEKGNGVANVPWNKVPYLTQESTEGAGANALRVRRNLLRKSQQA